MKLDERRLAIMAACAFLGTRRVAEAFKVSREVVRALRNEAIRTGKLDHLKEEMGRRALAGADAVLDRIIDEVDDLPRASLAITYGILKDKGLLLTGQPTSRVEHTVATTHDDINSWIDSLPSANPVPAGEVAGQKGPGLGLAALPAGDSRSPVSLPIVEGTPADRADHGQTEPKKEPAS